MTDKTPRPKAAVTRKRAKYGWRMAGGAGLVRTLTADEYRIFRETRELPRAGNVSAPISEGFGWMWMQPTLDPDRVNAPPRRVRRHGRWTLTTRIIKRFKAMERETMLMVAHDRTIYTTDEAAKAGAEVIGRFNAAMARRGLGARIDFKTADSFCLRELWPGAGMDALRILTGPELYERGPDGWCGPFLEGLMLCLLNPQPDEESYRNLAKREWEKRLRQTKQGKAFQPPRLTSGLKIGNQTSNSERLRPSGAQGRRPRSGRKLSNKGVGVGVSSSSTPSGSDSTILVASNEFNDLAADTTDGQKAKTRQTQQLQRLSYPGPPKARIYIGHYFLDN